MTETIMFNFDPELQRTWSRALQASRQEFPGQTTGWYDHLNETYGITLVMMDMGIAGVRIIDPDKAVLFKLRWL